MRTLTGLLVSLVLSFLGSPARAQGILPVGQIDPHAMPLKQVAVLAVPALDRVAIAADDAQRHLNGMPARYAIPVPVQADTTRGTWENLDAAWSLWRLRVLSPGASHVNLGLARVNLPPTSRLMFYAADYSAVLRPFDQTDVSPNGELWTPVVPGEEIVVEVYVQTSRRPAVNLAITQVGSGYRFFGAGPTALSPLGMDPEPAGACNVDVNCPQGSGWWSEIPSVAAISTGGSIFCTGFMVNNTAQDGRNYFMTAYHCGIRSGNASSLVCYWNYQNATCGVRNYNLNQFSTGSTLRASWSTSDFTLVELNQTPNPAWGVTYGGWDHSGANASSATAIHHPSGDVKKISFEYQATQTTSYLGTSSPGDGTHVRIVDWDVGTTEPGSSGSPLFDQNHHVIGQLHGGYAACGNNSSDWYGKFALSWTGGGTASTRLSNWLDPLGTGQLWLDTLGSTSASAGAYGTGCYQSFASFYETFSGAFDLGGSASAPNGITALRSGTNYVVNAAPGAWRAPASPDLGLTDDSVSQPLSMPFSFPYAGGSTNVIRMCSNGYVWLNGTSTTADYTPSASELVSQPARLCPYWMDLNPAAGGTTHYDVDPSGTAVYLTWLAVPEYGSSSSLNDVQCVLRSSGTFEFRWRSVASASHTILVGQSPGGGAALPPATDISVAMPFSFGADATGLGLSAGNRPVLGTTQHLSVDDIPPGSTLAFVFLGFTQHSSGIDLAPIGMPGCRQYCSLDASSALPVSGPSVPYSLPIPNQASFAGLHVYAQAATLSAGFNSLGALSSNGIDLRLEAN
ncbi:MAG: hypothetical protein Fur0037_14960 [Planctomycetota bacterium]